MRSSFLSTSICAAAAALSVAAAATHAAPTRTTFVTVKMTEYHFQLSVNRVRTGTVVFTVVNKGQLPHTFEIQRLRKVTPLVQPGRKAVLRVTFKKAGTYYYLCTVGAHVQYGMAGNLRVTR